MLPWFESFIAALSTRVSEKRLHHALLLSGPKGIGKHEAANDIARVALCKDLHAGGDACGVCQSCQLFAAGSHPDFQYVTTEKTQISVDSIREAIQNLHSRAQLNHNKVLIIASAHLMSESAANALLKTLEEPTESTYILLVTDHASRLLPTILSRCEKHALSAPQPEVSIKWLRNKMQDHSNVETIDADLLAAYSNAPMKVLEFLSNENAKGHAAFNATLDALKNKASDPQTEAQQWQDELEQVLTWSQLHIAQRAKQVSALLSARLWAQYQECAALSVKARHAGVNKVLLLTQLFLLLSELE